ncbi:MAG TPA: R3H domain-containing nucleic acid-binding protein [Candidatus Paceibacterota bacterium]|nr:R3H domain-containing nucleic acid-binding protein [Candidatus Paceibacterota bacterium]HPT40156.1 R3H domain-containing nucleic acid-binding protein [Candidatus Paceibacterota bacterium]
MEQIKQLIEKIISFFDADSSVDLSENEDTLRINIRMDDAGFLIGANGDNLRELEFLLRTILQRQNYGKRIFLDINNYRRLREDNLKDLAKEIAHKVTLTKKAHALPPMNAYERRIIHMELATNPDIATESEGEGPDRHLIVKPYP